MKLLVTVVPLIAVVFAISTASVARAQQASISDEKTEEIKTGTISGKVVNESGQALANAAVFVRPINSAMQGRSTATDSDGSFQISGLDPAMYIVSASLPAYAAPTRDPQDTQTNYYRIGDSVRIELIKGGVITGTVVTPTGEPLVGIRVHANLIRDASGLAPRYPALFRERTTDDRGIYRIYGLPPGTYTVSAGGAGFGPSFLNAYDSDAPTFAPSSTRDTAAEITVRSGEETGSVDIRYRNAQGHAVSGAINGPANTNSSFNGVSVTLTLMVNGVPVSALNSFLGAGNRSFAFYGVADGEYDLNARATMGPDDSAVSDPRHVTVKGADITGLELVTKPMASISGHLSLEDSKAPECKSKRRPFFAETFIAARRNEQEPAKNELRLFNVSGLAAGPDKVGDFSLRNLTAGQYSFEVKFFARYWYLQSIQLQSSATATTVRSTAASLPINAARNWTTVKSGDRIRNLNVSLAQGAAALRGQVTAPEGQKLPAKLSLYLVPAERDKADDVLRFFTSQVTGDGSFALSNVPPGHYWLVARAASNEPFTNSRLRSPDENTTRAKLRSEVEGAKTELELKPCQNVTDYRLPIKM